MTEYYVLWLKIHGTLKDYHHKNEEACFITSCKIFMGF